VAAVLVERLMVTFITGSENKFREVQRILGFPLTRVAIDLEEIQAIALEPVAAHKARQAYAVLGRPVLVEDTGLSFAAWKGLPGALIKWFLATVGTDGMCRLLHGEANRTAAATTVVGYCDSMGYQTFAGAVEGVIVNTPRGTGGFGWDSLFQPFGSHHTFAEMLPEEKDRFSMRRLALEELKKSGLLDSG
jgi:non-canonical purine NTP pyrophosphatase (RdgB/HAM1 family)